MKFAIFFVLLALPLSVRAQITLEHTYHVSPGSNLYLVEVDSGLWKYVYYVYADSIILFNLDHSVDRSIRIQDSTFSLFYGNSILMISRHLFDLDDHYEVLMQDNRGVRVYKDDGTTEFRCDTCYLGYVAINTYPNSGGIPILETNQGTKMIIWHDSSRYFYSLPGKLPGRTKSLGVSHNASGSIRHSAYPSSAYPNPTSGEFRINYEFPKGLSSGELVLTDETGREVKRYQVTNAFSDLLIDGSNLPDGSYFYRVVTSNGAGAAQKFEVVK